MTATTDTNLDDHAARFAANLIGFILLVGAAICAGILQAKVLTDLWRWFVAPLGVPQLGIVQAMGISLVVSVLTHRVSTNTEKAKHWWAGPWRVVYHGTVYTLIAWATGAAYAHYL